MNKKEFKRYVYQYHPNRQKKMIKSFYDTMTMPRYTTDELIRLLEKLGFNLICQKTETPPYAKQIIKFKNKIKQFDYLIKKNSKSTHLDLITSVHHLVLQKNF
jgi:predicted nucleotidyltransferase